MRGPQAKTSAFGVASCGTEQHSGSLSTLAGRARIACVDPLVPGLSRESWGGLFHGLVSRILVVGRRSRAGTRSVRLAEVDPRRRCRRRAGEGARNRSRRHPQDARRHEQQRRRAGSPATGAGPGDDGGAGRQAFGAAPVLYVAQPAQGRTDAGLGRARRVGELRGGRQERQQEGRLQVQPEGRPRHVRWPRRPSVVRRQGQGLRRLRSRPGAGPGRRQPQGDARREDQRRSEEGVPGG